MRDEIEKLAKVANIPIEWNDKGWVRAFYRGKWYPFFSPPEIMRKTLITMTQPNHPEATKLRPGAFGA